MLWIITSCVLVWSIWSIRSYLNSRNVDGSALNVKTLVLHSCAFGIFAIAMILNEIGIVFLSVAQFRGKRVYLATKTLYFSWVFVTVLSFIAQVLLCFIFLNLSRKPEEDERNTETTETSI